MIAVIFEVEPRPGQRQHYLDAAAALRPLLEEIDGFISIERFQSLTNENKFLSLSFFADESAIEAWRNIRAHRAAQSRARATLFENYRLRIAGVIRDYGMHDRAQAPDDSRETHL
ncbi:MAG: antibiotic biosynthesis monooxygenase [Rhodospirillales bacterium]|jgi:heme-degrading monooxygenase HmoA|nr:antibiotic biosynthesis monooxygenase [Rhodospirillales bacterium]